MALAEILCSERRGVPFVMRVGVYLYLVQCWLLVDTQTVLASLDKLHLRHIKDRRP